MMLLHTTCCRHLQHTADTCITKHAKTSIQQNSIRMQTRQSPAFLLHRNACFKSRGPGPSKLRDERHAKIHAAQHPMCWNIHRPPAATPHKAALPQAKTCYEPYAATFQGKNCQPKPGRTRNGLVIVDPPPVCERRVNLLVYSLSLHRHSSIGFILAFASSIHNKQQHSRHPISL